MPSCVSVTCLLLPGAADFGHQGRERENVGRRSVWKPVTALRSVLQSQCYGKHHSEAAVSACTSSRLAMLDDKRSTLMSTFERPCRRWVPSKAPCRNFAGEGNRAWNKTHCYLPAWALGVILNILFAAEAACCTCK